MFPKNLLMPLFWLALAFCVVIFSMRVYWEIVEDIPTDDNIGKFWNHIWYDLRGKNLKEWKAEDHIKKPVVPKTVVKPIIKPVEKSLPTKATNDTFNLDKLAYAIAMAETWDCKKWYGVTHSNCHWIKSWNTYPCKTKPWSKMCIFKDKEESYKAFKIIWGKWYKTFPTALQASRWTWADASISWRKNVSHYYFQ